MNIVVIIILSVIGMNSDNVSATDILADSVRSFSEHTTQL